MFFEGVGANFRRKFRMEGGVAHRPLLGQNSKVIALSCGVKISAVRYLVLSQSTRVTDGQTE